MKNIRLGALNVNTVVMDADQISSAIVDTSIEISKKQNDAYDSGNTRILSTYCYETSSDNDISYTRYVGSDTKIVSQTTPGTAFLESNFTVPPGVNWLKSISDISSLFNDTDLGICVARRINNNIRLIDLKPIKASAGEIDVGMPVSCGDYVGIVRFSNEPTKSFNYNAIDLRQCTKEYVDSIQPSYILQNIYLSNYTDKVGHISSNFLTDPYYEGHAGQVMFALSASCKYNFQNLQNCNTVKQSVSTYKFSNVKDQSQLTSDFQAGMSKKYIFTTNEFAVDSKSNMLKSVFFNGTKEKVGKDIAVAIIRDDVIVDICFTKINNGDTDVNLHVAEGDRIALGTYDDDSAFMFKYINVGEETSRYAKVAFIGSDWGDVSKCIGKRVQDGIGKINKVDIIYNCIFKFASADSESANVISTSSGKKKIRALFIGNSLTQNQVVYLPHLLKETYGDDIDFELGICMNSSSYIQTYVDDLIPNNKNIGMFSYTNNLDKWTWYQDQKTLDDVLKEYEFDLISIQAFIDSKTKCTTEMAKIKAMYDWLYKTYAKYHGKAAFKLCYLTHPDYRSNLFNDIIDTAKKACALVPVEMVFNCGEASENAKQFMTLGQLTDTEGTGVPKVHNRWGLPCWLGAYVLMTKLSEYYGFRNAVIGNNLRAQSDDVSKYKLYGVNGSMQYLPESTWIKGQVAAVNAAQRQFISYDKISQQYIETIQNLSSYAQQLEMNISSLCEYYDNKIDSLYCGNVFLNVDGNKTYVENPDLLSNYTYNTASEADNKLRKVVKTGSAVKKLNNNCFLSCINLTEVNTNALTVGMYAFGYCSSLSSISCLNATRLETFAFRYGNSINYALKYINSKEGDPIAAVFPNVSSVGQYVLGYADGGYKTASFPQLTTLNNCGSESFSRINKTFALSDIWLEGMTKTEFLQNRIASDGPYKGQTVPGGTWLGLHFDGNKAHLKDGVTMQFDGTTSAWNEI